MERVKINDGTTWPDPTGDRYRDISWMLRYNHTAVTRSMMLEIAEVMGSYESLITHPAFTLRRVQEKISGVRKAIKAKAART